MNAKIFSSALSSWNVKNIFYKCIQMNEKCLLSRFRRFASKMVVNAKVLYGAILVCVLVGKSCSLEIDYLGDYLTDEEYRNREICSTKVCMEDNDRLVYAATRNSSIKPCEDIKTFAAGEFLKHRVLNDRYIYIGFQNDVNRLNKERQRIILKQKIKDDEPRMFKIMKNFFKKCIDSGLFLFAKNYKSI